MYIFFGLAKEFHKNISFHILFHEIQVCFFSQKKEDNSNNEYHHGVNNVGSFFTGR